MAQKKLAKYDVSIEVLRQQFADRGYKLITDYVEGRSMQKLEYICLKHEDKGTLTITHGHFLQNRGCYYCGREKTESTRRLDLNNPTLIQECKSLCESKDFEFVDIIRENSKLYIRFYCNKHRDLGLQKMKKGNMEREGIIGCQYCCSKNLPEEYVLKKAKEINPYIQLLEPYKNLTTRMDCMCIKHNLKHRKTMQKILEGKGCYYCGLEKLSEGFTLSQEEYEELFYENNKDFEVVGKYTGQENHIDVQCKTCGYIFDPHAAYAARHKILCKKCGGYHNEVAIENCLNQWGIKYKPQYMFTDCCDKRPLPFDFAVFDYETDQVIGVIEYDGEGHYRPAQVNAKMKEVHAKLSYVRTVKHDAIKSNYCKNNHIPLLRIPYWEKDDIEYLLFDFLVNIGLIEEIKH